MLRKFFRTELFKRVPFYLKRSDFWRLRRQNRNSKELGLVTKRFLKSTSSTILLQKQKQQLKKMALRQSIEITSELIGGLVVKTYTLDRKRRYTLKQSETKTFQIVWSLFVLREICPKRYSLNLAKMFFVETYAKKVIT